MDINQAVWCVLYGVGLACSLMLAEMVVAEVVFWCYYYWFYAA